MGKYIKVFDTTLRDGEQTPGVALTAEAKLEIAHQLQKLGVDIIEAGFPVSSPGEFVAVEAVALRIRGPVIAGLARTNPQDIDRAWEALRGADKARIHTFIATSDIHLQYKLRKTREEVLQMAIQAVERARRYTKDVEFSAEDATRSDPDFVGKVFAAAVKAGATTINVPDTVGYTTPAEYARLIRYLREIEPCLDDVAISVHCHNDLGMAVANSLSAIEAGATQVECTINGLGERAGNASLEELVMALATRRDCYDASTGIRTEQIYRTSRLVSTLSGIGVQANKAIVGSNAFAHQSGIHQDGILKSRATYEIMTPESIGLQSNKLVLGKLSGRHAFREHLREMGYPLEGEALEKAFARFKQLADRKAEWNDSDLEAIVEAESDTVPVTYRLDSLQVMSGSSVVPSATVAISHHDTVTTEACTGDGPVDAIYKAIERVTLTGARLVHYSIRAVSEGEDALGEVSVRLSRDGQVGIGRGVSTDILEASARAYINAVNRFLHQQKTPTKEER